MERKLEKKDIAGYLPYDLHCFNCDEMIEVIDFTNVGNLFRGIELHDEVEDDEWAASQQYKPILYSIDFLYKTISHNGKEIVPIVELAKMSIPNTKWKLSNSRNYAINQTDERFGYDKFLYKFYYNSTIFLNLSVNNQYQLFDYLHELKIDYRGLIDSGLAIDVNTLETNPYK